MNWQIVNSFYTWIDKQLSIGSSFEEYDMDHGNVTIYSWMSRQGVYSGPAALVGYRNLRTGFSHRFISLACKLPASPTRDHTRIYLRSRQKERYVNILGNSCNIWPCLITKSLILSNMKKLTLSCRDRRFRYIRRKGTSPTH